jgi:hypothetical protein
MTENFLISDSLKGSLTKEDLCVNNAYDKNIVPIIKEIRIADGKVEIDVDVNCGNIARGFDINQLKFKENNIHLNRNIFFKTKRIYYNEAKSVLHTIVIDEEEFWSNL